VPEFRSFARVRLTRRVRYDGDMAKKVTDPFSAHEALDRAHLVASIFGDFVADHPFIRGHPKLRRQAGELAEKLGMLYQAVGQVSFDEDDPMSPDELATELGINPKTLRGFLRKRFRRDPKLLGSRWRLGKEHIDAARRNWKAT